MGIHWPATQNLNIGLATTILYFVDVQASVIKQSNLVPQFWRMIDTWTGNLIKTLFQFGSVNKYEYWKFQEGLFWQGLNKRDSRSPAEVRIYPVAAGC